MSLSKSKLYACNLYSLTRKAQHYARKRINDHGKAESDLLALFTRFVHMVGK